MYLVTENYCKKHNLSIEEFLKLDEKYAILNYVAECPDIFDSLTNSEMVEEAILTWKRQNNVSGYVVYRANTSKGIYKKVKEIKKNKTIQYSTGVLKKGKTYYFKIRSYKNVNGKQVYGAYSNVKSVKRF